MFLRQKKAASNTGDFCRGREETGHYTQMFKTAKGQFCRSRHSPLQIAGFSGVISWPARAVEPVRQE